MTGRPAEIPRTTSATRHGKINLHLGVGDAREDGYHELTTVFQSVALAETVTLTALDGPEASTVLTVQGFDAHLVPTDSTNLAWKAVDRIQKLAGVDVPVSIHIDKGIPVAGGMAGGSADAAAALVAAVDMFCTPDNRPSNEELLTIAADLGADVPFCLIGGTALGTGKGEQLTPVLSQGRFHWAIATDKRGLSTPKVFAQLDRQRESRPGVRAGSPDQLIRALRSGDPHELVPLLTNDLQAPALSLLPSLRETLTAAREAGALAAIVSGSGPTIAMLCESESQAVDVATAVSAAGKASATMTTTSPAAES